MNIYENLQNLQETDSDLAFQNIVQYIKESSWETVKKDFYNYKLKDFYLKKEEIIKKYIQDRGYINYFLHKFLRPIPIVGKFVFDTLKGRRVDSDFYNLPALFWGYVEYPLKSVLEIYKNTGSGYKDVYYELNDEKSKNVFIHLMLFKLTGNREYCRQVQSKDEEQYFARDVVKFRENEVFVDCGAFIGDTAVTFMENYMVTTKTSENTLYLYEIDEENIKKASNIISKYENVKIKIRPCGVSDQEGKVRAFLGQGASSSLLSSRNQTAEAAEVIITSLDIDIKEKITFIKMDIEGAEKEALLGARNHIKKEHPKLAICIYHKISDLWEIPLLIKELYSGYKLYMRHYSECEYETVIYAVIE